MLYKAVRFAIKAVREEGASFAGHAACFGNIDRMGDICVAGCFEKHLPAFLADGVVAWQHDWSEPIGKPTWAAEDREGLAFEAVLSDTTQGRDARTLIRDGVVRKMSLGYDVRASEPLTAENIEEYVDLKSVELHELERALLWGQALKELYVYEISPVSVPANNRAEITQRKGVLPDGTLLEEQFRFALAANADCIARFRSLQDLRRAEGRVLSETNRVRLQQLEAALKSVREELAPLLALPPPTALQLYHQFLAMEARLNGAL